MDSDTYELIIAVIGVGFTLLSAAVIGLVYILNLANKRANESVPAPTAEKLGDLLPPWALDMVLMLIEAGLYGADRTETPSDNALLQRMKDEFTPGAPPAQPTVTELVEGAEG